MELIITAFYIAFIWLIWYKWKLLRANIFWKVTWPSLWCIAISLELISLGQFCPYSKNAFVSTYVYQIAPEYGGKVISVDVEANTPVKKGQALFHMDPTPWQHKVTEAAATLAIAQQDVKVMKARVEEAQANVTSVQTELTLSQAELAQYQKGAKTQAVSKLKVEVAQDTVVAQTAQLQQAQAKLQESTLLYNSMFDGEHSSVALAQAQLDLAKYNLSQTNVLAPADGYVVDLNLQPGVEIGMKQKVMSFVNSEPENYWVVGKVPQFGMNRVGKGDRAEVMLSMYPAQVFEAKVVDVIWATGEAQVLTNAQLSSSQLNQTPGDIHFYMIKLKLVNPPQDFHERFGASGKAAIYSKSAPDALVFLRQLELRMDSWMSYLYQ